MLLLNASKSAPTPSSKFCVDVSWEPTRLLTTEFNADFVVEAEVATAPRFFKYIDWIGRFASMSDSSAPTLGIDLSDASEGGVKPVGRARS